jgi:hypothetical protein
MPTRRKRQPAYPNGHNSMTFKKHGPAPAILALLALAALLAFPAGPEQRVTASHSLPPQVGDQWAPYLEWSLSNLTYSGNPYDLVATATFRHTAGGETRTTEMFYDGGNTWKFRFSGTLAGQWTFTTHSADPDLNGHSGSVTIQPNPGEPGFVTQFGDQWGRKGTGEVFVPQFVMVGGPHVYYNDEAQLDQEIQLFLEDHGFNGINTPVFCRWFDIDRPRCSDISGSDPNPDPRTFEALEMMINRTYEAGGVVHIWVWGDSQRKQNANFLPGGVNGPVDRRLQRYIAARLGPLPGWTMGYGFDLWEWVSGDELTDWHSYMHERFGWPHLLGARASKNKLDQLSETLDYSSYEQHRPDYQKYVETIEARSCKPSFSEDRFRIGNNIPSKDYNMEMTRRGLWHSAMAGGVANIWGNLVGAIGANDGSTSSAPYPNREWIKTYSRFFEQRFLPGMVRCNELTDGVCLGQPARNAFVFYKENTTTINLDLSLMPGSQTALAVDARSAYAELPLGLLAPNFQVWTAPYASDWAIAVGDFNNLLTAAELLPPSSPVEPTRSVVEGNQPLEEVKPLLHGETFFLPTIFHGGPSSLICPPAVSMTDRRAPIQLPSITESYLYRSFVARLAETVYPLFSYGVTPLLVVALLIGLVSLALLRSRLWQ